MEHDRNLPMALYTMGIACLFLAGFFLLVILGAGTYRSTVEGQQENNRTRALLSYISTCARTGGGAWAVDIVEAEGTQVLEIADGSSGYCFRIYSHEGCLLEEYGKAGTEIDPSLAMEIERTELFLVERLAEDVYAVTTDAGRVLFSMGVRRKRKDRGSVW